MYRIAWIVLGLIAGFIGSKIVSRGSEGLVDIVLGIVGAIVGGWLAGFMGWAGVSGLNLYSICVAVGGAGSGAAGLPRDPQSGLTYSRPMENELGTVEGLGGIFTIRGDGDACGTAFATSRACRRKCQGNETVDERTAA